MDVGEQRAATLSDGIVLIFGNAIYYANILSLPCVCVLLFDVVLRVAM